MTKDQRVEVFYDLANKCVAKEGATSQDLEDILARRIPSTKAGSCIPACLAEMIGIVSKMKIKTTSIPNKHIFPFVLVNLDEKQ